MHVHFIGVGGTAMGSVAIACTMQGHTVTGSDGPLYPPMSTVLDTAGITRYEDYSAERLRALNPDLIVVGNAISRGNPELECVLTDRRSMTSMADFVGKHLISRNTSIVCTGTHGKTTTSSIAAWLLAHAGRLTALLGRCCSAVLTCPLSTLLPHSPDRCAACTRSTISPLSPPIRLDPFRSERIKESRYSCECELFLVLVSVSSQNNREGSLRVCLRC